MYNEVEVLDATEIGGFLTLPGLARAIPVYSAECYAYYKAWGRFRGHRRDLRKAINKVKFTRVAPISLNHLGIGISLKKKKRTVCQHLCK